MLFHHSSIAISFFCLLHFSFADSIRLPAGTPLSVILNEEIDSEKVEVGTVVDCLVKTQIVIHGQVLIPTGAIAEGIVTRVDKLCSGCSYSCSSVTIKVEQVQAVDGQYIYLKGLPHATKAPCGSYQSAIIPIGTTLKARVLNNRKIRV